MGHFILNAEKILFFVWNGIKFVLLSSIRPSKVFYALAKLYFFYCFTSQLGFFKSLRLGNSTVNPNWNFQIVKNFDKKKFEFKKWFSTWRAYELFVVSLIKRFTSIAVYKLSYSIFTMFSFQPQTKSNNDVSLLNVTTRLVLCPVLFRN